MDTRCSLPLFSLPLPLPQVNHHLRADIESPSPPAQARHVDEGAMSPCLQCAAMQGRPEQDGGSWGMQDKASSNRCWSLYTGNRQKVSTPRLRLVGGRPALGGPCPSPEWHAPPPHWLACTPAAHAPDQCSCWSHRSHAAGPRLTELCYAL